MAMADVASADSPVVAGRLPDWWFPTTVVRRFPDGRPLAGAGFVFGLAFYALATILVTLFDSNGGARLTVLDITGQHMMAIAPGLVLAVVLTGTRGTAERRSLDDWTLVAVTVLAALVVVLAVVGLVVELTDWTSFWGTFYGLMIRVGAGVSAGASGLWSLGRLWEARIEERGTLISV